MALGHGHLCKALESGVKFIDTRATEIHSSVVQHLESAADYYLSAGFSSASEYSRAIGYLFDAYVYVDDAKKQNDTRRKSQLYAMAEKVLKASADAFERAAHPEKREQALRLLDRVKEERELVLSLNEILVASSIVSTTEAFPTPAPTYEEATGLDRFQHADIQTHLTAPNEVTVGDELNLQLDLVNVASNYGLLVRIQNLVPPGLMVTRLPPQYTMEKNGSIEMRGKRLEPLRVETVKIVLKANETGDVDLRPEVTYVNDLGEFRTHRPQPITILIRPKLAFKFENQTSQLVFDFLSMSYVEDYVKARMPHENSGWRTLMEMVRQRKTSWSSIYGISKRKDPVAELERLGLIEVRIFHGQRGRGGKIRKARINLRNETAKHALQEKMRQTEE